MEDARRLFETGQLGAAIQSISQEVKARPSDVQPRIFLFELLCFAGDFDRAERQLEALGHQSVSTELGVQVYLNNIKAERDRSRLFSDGLEPHFLTEPPSYVDLLLAAIKRVRESNYKDARELLDRADEERPALGGEMAGSQFSDFRDYDDRIGPVLELIVRDKYTWLPLEQVRRLKITRPKQLRDLMWAPAQIEGADGTVGEVFVPALYVGSSKHENDQVKLGRMTDWISISDDLSLATGLRIFIVANEASGSVEQSALFGIGEIAFHGVTEKNRAAQP
jgi:type VI secretion system protein ImpE